MIKPIHLLFNKSTTMHGESCYQQASSDYEDLDDLLDRLDIRNEVKAAIMAQISILLVSYFEYGFHSKSES